MSLYGLALCAGYAGLEVGIRRAGLPVRFVCYVEREAYAAANLARLMEASRLDSAPIWDDLSTFDAREWREHISIVTAGWPCQPFSAAGKRSHLEDPRWVWGDIARILCDVRPSIVFLENVPGVAFRGLAPVLATLAALGFDAEWGTVRAEDAGAPHRRTRMFILAADAHKGRSIIRRFVADTGRARAREDQRGRLVAGHRAPSQSRTGDRGAPHAGAFGDHVADADDHRLAKRGASHDADRDHERRDDPDRRHAYPPAPGDEQGWIEYIRSGGPAPGIRRSDYGTTDRVDRLRLLGNGVVPDQAALAFQILAERMT